MNMMDYAWNHLKKIVDGMSTTVNRTGQSFPVEIPVQEEKKEIYEG